MLGHVIDGDVANQFGLINYFVPHEELATTARVLAAKLAAGPVDAHAVTKRMLNREAHLDARGRHRGRGAAQAACLQAEAFRKAARRYGKELSGATLHRRPARAPARDSVARARARGCDRAQRPVTPRGCLAEAGVLQLCVPAAYGGVVDETSRRSRSSSRARCSRPSRPTATPRSPCRRSRRCPSRWAGTKEQRERWLPALASGRERGAFALTERESGSDVGALATTATREGDGYRLDGEKVAHLGRARRDGARRVRAHGRRRRQARRLGLRRAEDDARRLARADAEPRRARARERAPRRRARAAVGARSARRATASRSRCARSSSCAPRWAPPPAAWRRARST